MTPATRGPDPVDLVRYVLPTGVTRSCESFRQDGVDPWFGPPALSPGPGRLYLAYAFKPSESEPYALKMHIRGAGDAQFLLLTDATHADGVLNSAPGAAGVYTHVALAPTPKGPLLAWVEGAGSAAEVRATRYDEAAGAFLDPLTGAPGTSAVAPALPDGSSWSAPGPPAVVAVGTTPYVAWTGAGTGRRLWVAHADRDARKWVLDSGPNSDGALNAAACDVSPPSLALVDGFVAVAFTESCAILNSPQSQNLLWVKRLE